MVNFIVEEEVEEYIYEHIELVNGDFDLVNADCVILLNWSMVIYKNRLLFIEDDGKLILKKG